MINTNKNKNKNKSSDRQLKKGKVFREVKVEDLREDYLLKGLEDMCGQKECSLGLGEEESSGTGSIELYCRFCNLSILGDSLVEIDEELKQRKRK